MAVDPTARIDALVTEHMDYARGIAVAAKRKLPPFICLSDLVSEAYVGLVQAAWKYRAGSKVPFKAFAKRRIHGAVMDSVRRKNFRHTSTLQLNEYSDAIASLKHNPMEQVEEDLDRATHGVRVQAVIAELPSLDRKIVQLRYYQGKNGKQAGRAIGKGESRSSQLHQRTLEALRLRGDQLKEPKPMSKATALEEARKAAVVDELGEVKKRIRHLKSDAERVKVLSSEVLSWTAKLPIAEGTSYAGKKFIANVTAKTLQREITNMEAAMEAIGKDAFLKNCDLTLKVLDALTTAAERAGFVSEERTGTRRITVEPISTDSKKAA